MATASEVTITQPVIKIDGQNLNDKLYGALMEVCVENDLHQPDVATILLHINSFELHGTDVIDGPLAQYFKKGAKLEISMAQNGKAQGGPIFVGEVISLGPDFGRWSANDPWLVRIVAQDKTHRLTSGRASETYLNQSYSDIVKKVAQNCGLSAVVDSTSQVHDHVVQANQTPWEFLKYLAARVGYDVYVSGDKLNFKKPQKSSDSAIELRWGVSLSQFNADASVAFQVKTVNVRGWDPKQQKAIVGKATTGKNGFEAALGESKSGADVAKATRADETHIGIWPVVDQKEANTIAEALAYDMERDYVHAEGVTTVGMPDILPGKLVEISGIGTRFSGKYLVTSTNHTFSGHEGYTTTFAVGGSQPDSLSRSTGGGNNVRPEYPGVVIAKVTNIKDPENTNRVKVKYPWLSDDIESDWARIAVPDAGNDRGFQWLPEVDDEVLVAFEHGDINWPFILGGLYSGKNKPPVPASEAIKSDKVVQRVIKSRSGHTILLNDEQGKEQIVIRDKTGKNEIVIDSKENTMTIKVDKDIMLEAGGKIDIKGAQAITIASAQQDVNIECQNFKVTAKQGAEISANTSLDLKANASMSLKANAQMNVEASGPTAIKGAIVNIG